MSAYLLHTLEVCEVTLLVETGCVQTERVDDINDLLLRILGALLSLLSGRIRTSVCNTVSSCGREVVLDVGRECAPNCSPPTVIFLQSAS
jgi:hypothetical protein